MTQQVPSPRTGTSDNDRINVAPNTQPQPQPRRFHENLTTEQAGHQGLAPAGIAPAQTPKSGWEIAYELLGFPLSWHSNAGVRYTDSQSYPLRPTSNTSQAYPRCDAELTKDGQSLVPLVVQAADYLEHERNSTWQRHSITAVTTVMMKISQSPLLAKARFESNFKDKSWVTWGAWTYYVFHWHIVGQVGVWVWFVFRLLWHFIRIIIFGNSPRQKEQGYKPFFYEDTRYPRIASNPTDNRKRENRVGYDGPVDGDRWGTYGLFRPRVLLQVDGDSTPKHVRKFNETVSYPEYVFIAFSFNHFDLENEDLTTELIRVGTKITQKLGYKYFWVSASCMGFSEDEERTLSEDEKKKISEQDLYGISDVVRGASRVAILLPDPKGGKCKGLKHLNVAGSATSPDNQILDRLKEWGSRVWTFPEVLLGPDVALHICWKTESEIQWYELKKHEFPEKVWTDDSKRSMQMVRHYKNIALTRLEFVKIVMDCLLHRQQQKNGINWHYPGDLSYVLMGFLRIRPPINKFDSSLQAFARLSLPADNDRLMERFLCLSSDSEDANWANLTDSFAVSLWSIQPSIQISGVGENDTIIIEKALGARIELSRFSDMSAVDLSYWRRLVGISAGLMIVPPWCEMMATWFRRMKYTECLPRFYGFEGFMKLEQIEEKLFGAKPGFLSWSTNASSFSQHVPGAPVYEPKSQGSGDQGKSFAGLKFDLEAQRGARGPERESIEVDGRILTYPIIGEQPWVDCPCANSNACRCEGMTDRELRKIGQGEMGKQKIWTLIDTTTMTVTLLKAIWPPQALIACGTEGGMERVLVCSYDWTTGVMYKESVLRFPGKILESMHSLPGIRLGLKRALDSLQENSVAAPGGGDSNAGMQRTNNEEIVAEKETNQVVIVESGKNEVRNERPKATEGTGLN